MMSVFARPEISGDVLSSPAAISLIRGVLFMCISCGCGLPHDKHNNPDLITIDDLQRAAKAANMSTDDAAKNIADYVGLHCHK